MTNLARNGSFEQIEDGKALHIRASDGWNGTRLFLETEDACDGNCCLKMISTDSAFTWFQVAAGELIPGGVYRVTFMAKGYVRNNANRPGTFGIDVEYYNDNWVREKRTFMRLSGLGPFTPGENWQLFEGTIEMPAGGCGINLTVGVHGAGSCVYFDDFKICQIGWQEPKDFRPRSGATEAPDRPKAPQYANLLPDQVFYYPEAKVGTAAVQFIHSAACSADISLLDGDALLLKKENPVSMEYDLSLLAEKKHAYTLRAVVRDANHAVLETLEEQIYIYDRPTALNEHGEYVNPDGTIFHPVMAFWQPWPWDHVPLSAQSGVNCILWNPLHLTLEEQRKQLDDLHAVGVKANVVLFWDMQPPAHPINAERIVACVENIKDHPAIYCWNIADEPFSTASATKDMTVRQMMIASYKLVRDLDDKYPVSYVEDIPAMYSFADHYADVIQIDPYPGTENYACFNGDMVAKICAETDRPVISLLQGITFKWVRPYDFEMHSMIYQTFLGGGRSVGYYGFGESGRSEKEGPLETSRDLWPAIKGFYDSGEYEILFRHYSSGKESNLISVREDGVWYDVWETGGVRYAAVQNRTWEKQTVEISVENCSAVEPVCWKAEIRPEIQVKTGGFSVTLSDSQAILLEINEK